ncbi:cyclopropane-fatty-acyl-phospholipid synthase family protein [Bradyrhizobium sp. LHD-71]|uniref:cyclopropane-fatty-acyl-phospholipid synthase family protein n=1 Tax=Bradyrhizobium sp. LHD-71 TaxID=3072141 RepID=UPI00280C6623|nr:cyclopropane-fatty-acyl-phospholipid synthase family protein [Bradyrhizobium sp. LHD-71]MDQ8729867.1 cyclopropane-fatty-acyl-phospholipid synthase family protein [Bradyrhizobium sp. LHD-71]
MDRVLRYFLTTGIRHGSVTVATPDGAVFVCGDGSGVPIKVRFVTRSAVRRVLLDPELTFGELYMDGEVRLEQGSIADLIAVLLEQPGAGTPQWARLQAALRSLARRVRQFNPRGRALRNVAHHYDLDGRLYALFLDADRQYSCAYFDKPGLSLEEAQLAKKRHIAAKLLLEQNHSILDIGSGWGGLARYLSDVSSCRVTGVTLSTEQLRYAHNRLSENPSPGVEFRLQDYRDVKGPFNRIVSVGMFEHVGVGHYDAFFRRCAELLTDDGVMLLHSIGRSEGPSSTSPWMEKYIFPGGYIPALSEVLPAIERAGLLVNDIEILRLHYAETLKMWRERFLARKEDAERLYDERFVRMWEFYLAAAEMSFRKQAMMNFQIQITKRQGVVPMTRHYIIEAEERMRLVESRFKEPKLQLAGE